MPEIFNNKYWNSEVFGKYLETVPRVKQNAFLKAGILRTRSDLKNMLVEQTGGNFITIPMTGRIGGEALNYDGDTDVTATGLDTFLQSMIVVGRMKAWEEKDFTFDITGKDFMEEIGRQVADYWDDVDQSTILAVMDGIFGVSEDGFSERHTLDITGKASAGDRIVGPSTLNDAAQKAFGDNKNLITMAIMHSQVATTLENLQLIEYRKQVDGEGIQKTVAIADWNGRTVMIDDDVPTTTSYTGAGVYTVTLAGSNASTGDKFTVAGTTYTVEEADTKTPTGVATSIATALGSDATYSVSRNGAVLTLTEKSGKYGTGAPAVSTTSESTTIAVETTTAPEGVTNYTTYLLGQGAFDYCDCGAKVPNEVWRDPKTDGGLDMLITRQRHLYAPRGFSFVMPSTPIISPTNAQLATAARWSIVKDTAGTGFFDSKAIPFARIISRG